ncbi:MAG: response regulator transcription factor, partial [Bacteroidota bacterium]
MNSRPIHVAIVEDEPEIRRLLSLVIDNSPGFACQLEFASAEEALRGLTSFQPDILLMDIQLPGMSGIEAVRELYHKEVPYPILMLTVQEDDDSIFDSLCAGASGYLTKETPPAVLLEAIREA